MMLFGTLQNVILSTVLYNVQNLFEISKTQLYLTSPSTVFVSLVNPLMTFLIVLFLFVAIHCTNLPDFFYIF